MSYRSMMILALGLSTRQCYSVQDSGGTTTLGFRQELVLGLGAAALVLTAIGVAMVLARPGPKRVTRLVLAAYAIFVGVLILPAMWRDRIVISPTEIWQKSGPWFTPNHKGFRYQNVKSVLRLEISASLRSGRMWVVEYVDGGREEFNLGTLWENNEDVIVAKLRGFGVQFR